MNQMEMWYWWERNKGLKIKKDGIKNLKEETEIAELMDEVEDLTGCIPLLLESCIVGGEFDLGAEAMRSIWNQAASFISERKEENNQYRWKRYFTFLEFKTSLTSIRYCDYVVACIIGNYTPPGMAPNLIDHRYFYEDKGRGKYACGLARDAVASQLRCHGMYQLGDLGILRSAAPCIRNRSAIGFFVEEAVLQAIRIGGLSVDSRIYQPMDMIPFDTVPTFDTSRERALYVPSRYAYRAIDGIILWVEQGRQPTDRKKKAALFPLQITIARSHSNSSQNFFNEWTKWEELLKDFDVQPTFLWITDGAPSSDDVDAKVRSTRRGNISVNPAHEVKHIPIKDVCKDAWEWYEAAEQERKRADQTLLALDQSVRETMSGKEVSSNEERNAENAVEGGEPETGGRSNAG